MSQAYLGPLLGAGCIGCLDSPLTPSIRALLVTNNRPELCGRWGGIKPASAACLYSDELERTKDIEEAVPDDEISPAKDGAPANEAAPAPEAELLNKPVIKESATDKNATTDDDTRHNLKELLKEAGPEKINMAKDEAPDELPKDVAADDATGHDQRELARQVGREDVNTGVPRWRSRRLK